MSGKNLGVFSKPLVKCLYNLAEQSGFQPVHCTIPAAISVVDDIVLILDKKNAVLFFLSFQNHLMCT